MNTWILYTKALLLSAGAVCLTIAIKTIVPVICTDVVLPFLKPPYLYILVNGIILTISASSLLHRTQSQPHVESTSFSITALEVDPPAEASPEYEGGEIVVELKPVIVNGLNVLEIGSDDSATETLFPATGREKSPSRSGHRKAMRSISHSNGIMTPNYKVETLDSIWMKIKEGTPRATHEAPQNLAARPLLPRDRLLDSSRWGTERRSNLHGRIRREPSLSEDELNRRVEAFIKKVNEEMRLERI